MSRVREFLRQYASWRRMYSPIKAARVAWYMMSAFEEPMF